MVEPAGHERASQLFLGKGLPHAAGPSAGDRLGREPNCRKAVRAPLTPHSYNLHVQPISFGTYALTPRWPTDYGRADNSILRLENNACPHSNLVERHWNGGTDARITQESTEARYMHNDIQVRSGSMIVLEFGNYTVREQATSKQAS